MITITRKGLTLSIDASVIPAQGSSDVPVQYIDDSDSYTGFTPQPSVGWITCTGFPKATIMQKDDDGNYLIPAEAFKTAGNIYIAVALVNDENPNHIEYTLRTQATVTPAPNGTVILPSDDEWQKVVKDYIDELFEKNYGPQFDQIQQDLENLVDEAQKQQDKANQQQAQIDNAIDVMGDYEIVSEDPTQIRFKKGNGEFGDTVDLGDGLASKSMVNAGYYQSVGNQYSGSASDYGIEVARIEGAYKQDGTPTPEAPIEPQFFHATAFNTNGGNLFDASKLPTKSQGGATVTNNGDGSFTISGSGNLTSAFNISKEYTHDDFIRMIHDGKLSLKTNNVSKAVPSIYFNIVDKSTQKTLITCYENQMIEITKEMLLNVNNVCRIGFYSGQGNKITPVTIKPVLYQDGDGTFYPFNASSTPVDIELRALPNGVKDTYENGVITRRVGVATFDGSDDENWQYFNVECNQFSIIVQGFKQDSAKPNVVCKYFKPDIIGNRTSIKEIIYTISTGIAINTDLAKDVQSWKTWLKSHPIKVWYELATPTTEQYTIPTFPSYYPFTNAWCDSELKTSITWNALTGKSAILDGQGNLIQKGYMTPQENLLLNSDFKGGIINQQGLTDYDFRSTGTVKLACDGWAVFKLWLKVKTNSVLLTNSDTSQHACYVYFAQPQIGKKTLYVNVVSKTGTGAKIELPEGGTYDLKQGYNIISFNITNSLNRISIAVQPNSTIEISQMKCENGDIFTGMPAWNQSVESLKCQSYFNVLKIRKAIFGTIANEINADTITIPKMRKKPSITWNVTTNVNLKKFNAIWLDNGTIAIGVSSNGTDVSLEAYVIIDAYDY